jgi:thioredoxin reductase (NADPH)
MLIDIAVIGAGPAGISASIYLKRAGFEPLVFERADIGGLLLNANLVENYPGFSGGIPGKALADLFRRQLEENGVKIEKVEVSRVDIENDSFRLSTLNDDYLARSVIVATGTSPKKVAIEGAEDFMDKKIFYEIKDVPFDKKGKSFTIIGGGDAAFDYALNLSRDDCHVSIVMRNERPKCLSLLEKRARGIPRIEVINGAVLERVEEEKGSLSLEYEHGDDVMKVQSDYILVACGREPDMKFMDGELLERLRINDAGDTNVPGLFLAGDVRRGDFRQVGIAVGDGISAAMSAVSYLEKGGAR